MLRKKFSKLEKGVGLDCSGNRASKKKFTGVGGGGGGVGGGGGWSPKSKIEAKRKPSHSCENSKISDRASMKYYRRKKGGDQKNGGGKRRDGGLQANGFQRHRESQGTHRIRESSSERKVGIDHIASGRGLS